ncbi:MAG: BBP7 family outer membrane beta-barrel protein [Pirellulaceae bacterium]|nr:BBP7 family outer membrane beta-barrel protein [Planctomycetales bacterium]
MKSFFTASVAMALGLFGTAAYAAQPNQSFGYPSILPNQGNSRVASRQVSYNEPTYVGPSAAVGSGCAPGAAVGAPVVSGVESIGPQYGAGPACDGGYSSGPVYYESSPYVQAMGGGWGGGYGVQLPSACPRWFGGAYGLIFNRVADDPVWISTSDTDPTRSYTNTADALDTSFGGFEARIGRTFDCCRWGMEVVYWGLFPSAAKTAVTTADVPGNLMPNFDFNDVYLDMVDATGTPYRDTMYNVIAGDPDQYGNAAPSRLHCVVRDSEIHNVEINFLSGSLFNTGGCCGGCGVGGCGVGDCGCNTCGSCGVSPRWGSFASAPRRLSANWLFGVRYFKFSDYMQLGFENQNGVMDGYDPWGTGNNDQVFWDIDVDNNLVGVQLGVDLDYNVTKALQLEVGSRFGLYGNHMSVVHNMYNAHGSAYLWNDPNQLFYSDTTRNDVAFLGELRVGGGYKVSKHLRLTGGYRAIVASGVATSTHQLPVAHLPAQMNHTSQIKSNGDLILHGVYVGGEFAF